MLLGLALLSVPGQGAAWAAASAAAPAPAPVPAPASAHSGVPTGAFTTASVVPPAFRAHAEQAAAVHYLTLDSAVLGQSRSVAVSLPASYDREPGLRYPVLVLLDGPQQLAHTESLVRFLARGELIPELLVVAVAPIARSRELTPARVTDTPRGPGPQPATPVVGPQTADAAQTGGADDFLAFIEHELLPALDRSYRTTAWRALFGHSYGGLFGLHALTTRPGLFQAHVLASPSLWWDEGQPLKRLQAAWPQVLAAPGERLLVLSSGRNERAITTSVDAVADFLQRQPAAALQGRLRWQRVQYAQDDHGTTPHATWADGLRLAFDGWPFDMPERVTPADYTAYLAHRHRRAQRYGADVPPSLFESTHFALAHAETGLTPQALQLACELARRHAPTPRVQGALGRIGRAMAHSAQTRHDAQAARDAEVVQLLAAGRASASGAAGQATATEPATPAGAAAESGSFGAALARCPSPARTAPSAH